MGETATATLILEYTELQEDDNGYCQAINYTTLGVNENGTPDLFNSEDQAVECFIDYVRDQWQAVEVVEDPSYIGWGRVVRVTTNEDNTGNYTLRVMEYEAE